MLKLGQTMTEGTVLTWLKKEGDAVSVGEPVVEVQTDKVNVEIACETSGILRRILVREGQCVPILTPLAYVGGLDEVLPSSDAR